MDITSLLAIGSAAWGAASVACCICDREDPLPSAAAMTVMVAAMVDTMVLGGRVLPMIAWVLLLLLAAALSALSTRPRRRGTPRALHLILTGWIIATTAGLGHATVATGAHPHGATGNVLWIALPTFAAALFSAHQLVAAWRRRGVGAVEHGVAAGGTLTMVAMMFTH